MCAVFGYNQGWDRTGKSLHRKANNNLYINRAPKTCLA